MEWTQMNEWRNEEHTNGFEKSELLSEGKKKVRGKKLK